MGVYKFINLLIKLIPLFCQGSCFKHYMYVSVISFVVLIRIVWTILAFRCGTSTTLRGGIGYQSCVWSDVNKIYVVLLKIQIHSIDIREGLMSSSCKYHPLIYFLTILLSSANKSIWLVNWNHRREEISNPVKLPKINDKNVSGNK